MRSVPRFVLLVLVAYVLAGLPSGDARAADTPDGEWTATGVVRSGEAVIEPGGLGTFKISGEKAEWTDIPRAFKKSGKGTVKLDAARKPPTFVLKEGDKTYKGEKVPKEPTSPSSRRR